MENIENTPVKDKKKKKEKKEKEKDLGDVQVVVSFIRMRFSPLNNKFADRQQFRGGALREAPSQA